MNKTKLTLLLVTACSLGLSMPVQARISHKNTTIAGYTVAGLSAIGAGAAGIFWYKNAKKLDDKTLGQEEREAILRKISKLQTACVGASILTVAAGAFAIREHITWNRENKKLEKKKAENEKFKAEFDEIIKRRVTNSTSISGTTKEEVDFLKQTFTSHFKWIAEDKTNLEITKAFNHRLKIMAKIFEKALKKEPLEDYEMAILADSYDYVVGNYSYIGTAVKHIHMKLDAKK